MKNLTAKQRREIYLKVANHLSTEPDLFFLCGYLKSMITHGDIVHNIEGNYYVGDGLPEFDSFQPTNGNTALWWIEEDDQCGVRITCMLLCAEMCNP